MVAVGGLPILLSSLEAVRWGSGSRSCGAFLAQPITIPAIVAPPGISAAQKQTWIGTLDKRHTSHGWKDALAKNGWTDAYLTGDRFAAFMTAQDKRVADILLTLGLA